MSTVDEDIAFGQAMRRGPRSMVTKDFKYIPSNRERHEEYRDLAVLDMSQYELNVAQGMRVRYDIVRRFKDPKSKRCTPIN